MGTNKHLAMKSVFFSLCIFLGLLSFAAGTSVLTQKVTYTGLTTAKYTANEKKIIEGGYLWANGWVKTTTTDKVVQPATGITATSSAVGTVVTFVVTQGSTFVGTKKTVTTTANKAATIAGQESWGNKNGVNSDGRCSGVGCTPAIVVTPVALPTTAAPTAAPANATSSASGGVQFSQIALSIPVVAMVISKIC